LLKTEEDRATLREVADAQSQIQYGGYAMTFDIGDSSAGALQTTVVTVAEPLEKLRELTRRSAALMSNLQLGNVTQTVEFQPDAETLGARTADVMRVQQEFNFPGLPPEAVEGIRKSTELMYGPDGMTQLMVYLGDRLVTTSGGGKTTMEEALAAQDRGGLLASASNASLANTRKALGEKANAIVLIDLGRLIVAYTKLMGEIIAAVGAGDNGASNPFGDAIADLTLEPSYLGISASVGAASISSTFFVPIEQAQSINSVAKPLFEQFQATFGTMVPGLQKLR